jgi:hypothetical protein
MIYKDKDDRAKERVILPFTPQPPSTHNKESKIVILAEIALAVFLAASIGFLLATRG